jgi:predicted ATPase
MLKSNEPAWKDFIDDMQSIFAGIEIVMEFDEDTDENINVYFQFPGGPRLPVDAAGTSVLQASQILAYISPFAPQVLILDEPDSHLHPDNQRILCDLIFKLAAKRRFQTLYIPLITRMILLLTVAEKSSWGDLSRCCSKNFVQSRESIFQART